MKKWILLCFFLFGIAFADTLTLREKLASAQTGSYLVTEQNKTFTFLLVNAKTDQSIVLEEVTVPASLFAQYRMPWRTWFEKGAPGHTSWIMTQINLQTGAFEEMFSFTHRGWVNFSGSNAFLTQLLNLPFSPVVASERRKIGLPPGYNSPDKRPFWHPRIVFQGAQVPGALTTVWKARWPADGSELSRKWIEIYLPDENSIASNLSLPVYFPYWIEVEGRIGSAKVRVVDSGIGVSSPAGKLPLRAPQVTAQNLTKAGLELYLKTPSYFQEFDIIAEGLDSFTFFPLPCKTYTQGETTCLFIPIEELEGQMREGESYRFSITPKDDPSLCIETKKPFFFELSTKMDAPQ